MNPHELEAWRRQRAQRRKELWRRYREHEEARIGETRRQAALQVLVTLAWALACSLAGQTPGQRLLRIRLVDRAGSPPTIAHWLVREGYGSVGHLRAFLPQRVRPPLSRWLCLTLSLGVIRSLCPIVNRDARTLGDLLAGTRMVRTG